MSKYQRTTVLAVLCLAVGIMAGRFSSVISTVIIGIAINLFSQVVLRFNEAGFLATLQRLIATLPVSRLRERLQQREATLPPPSHVPLRSRIVLTAIFLALTLLGVYIGRAPESEGFDITTTENGTTTVVESTTNSAASASDTTTTTTAPLQIISIEGPDSVECWSGNEEYSVTTNGVDVDSWRWDAGLVGLQTPFDEGPTAVLSFDIDPGFYTIQVTVNDETSASKVIQVTEGPGCPQRPQTLNPVIVGPGTVECGLSAEYSVTNGSGGAVFNTLVWTTSDAEIIGSTTSQSVNVVFNGPPGLYSVTVRVNDTAVTTTRFITVTGTSDGCPS